MFPPESDLAAKEDFVRFLAIFHRTFSAIIDYTHKGDIHGILLGGWLADTLHNVPFMLWSYQRRRLVLAAKNGGMDGSFSEKANPTTSTGTPH